MHRFVQSEIHVMIRDRSVPLCSVTWLESTYLVNSINYLHSSSLMGVDRETPSEIFRGVGVGVVSSLFRLFLHENRFGVLAAVTTNE